VPGLISTERVRQGVEARAAGDFGRAEELAQQAVDAEPWSATAHSRLAIALSDQGDLQGAEAEIGRAIDAEPDNWRWPLILAPIQAAEGNRAAARRTFRRGRHLAPYLDFYSPFSAYGQQVYTRSQLGRIYQREQERSAAQAAAAE
jgi:Flp pilus assembly protein TadD